MIKAEYPDTWPEVSADRSRLPSLFWVYDWQRQWLDRTVGSRDGIDAYNRAEAMVKDFDKECKKEFPLGEGEFYAKIAQSETGETVIAIVDPFMHRVHKTIPQSGELVLVDATSNLDRNDTKLFHLCVSKWNWCSTTSRDSNNKRRCKHHNIWPGVAKDSPACWSILWEGEGCWTSSIDDR